MKNLALFIALLCLPLKRLFSQIKIEWNQTIEISHTPIQKDSHSKYNAEYPRLLKLKNGNWLAAYTVRNNEGYNKEPEGGLQLEVSLSTDNGKTWKAISLLKDEGRDLDNAQMIQLTGGAVLLAGRSVRWQQSYRLPVFKSKDHGITWKKISVIDTNEGKPGELGKPDKGIYEPHFYLLNDGRLSVMYANEKHVTETPSFSQVISQRISGDGGLTWGQEIIVSSNAADKNSRPGMPVFTKMKNGKYIVVYEVCGPEKCNIYSKISDDGFNWQQGLGNPVPYQLAAPFIVSLSDGILVVTSNSSNISVSEDYGAHWYKIDSAWPATLWPSLYEKSTGEVGVVNSVAGQQTGHSIQVRVGKIAKY